MWGGCVRHADEQCNLAFLFRRQRRGRQHSCGFQELVALSLPEIDASQPHRRLVGFRSSPLFGQYAKRFTRLVVLLEPHLRNAQLQLGLGSPGGMRIGGEKFFQLFDGFGMPMWWASTTESTLPVR